MGGALVVAGVVIGMAMAGLRQGPVVSAQAGWECRAWTLESREGADEVGPWLGGAARVEITAASIDVGRQYALVACKQ